MNLRNQGPPRGKPQWTILSSRPVISQQHLKPFTTASFSAHPLLSALGFPLTSRLLLGFFCSLHALSPSLPLSGLIPWARSWTPTASVTCTHCWHQVLSLPHLSPSHSRTPAPRRAQQFPLHGSKTPQTQHDHNPNNNLSPTHPVSWASSVLYLNE